MGAGHMLAQAVRSVLVSIWSEYRRNLRSRRSVFPRLEALEARQLLDATLLRDINPWDAASLPLNPISCGSAVYYLNTDSEHGQELWKSDGTTAGTQLLKDIFPGSGSSDISGLVNVGGRLFFVANDGVNGSELWASDGTAAGTLMVKDIRSGLASSSPANLTVVGSTLFFTAFTDSAGIELWKSDGTTTGTVMVKDINPGVANAGIASLTNVNGLLFFGAYDSANGQELWKSDGTATGTVMAKDIYVGAGSSSPSNLFAAGSTLYFLASTSTAGRELWKSDGTSTGTLMVKDINPGSGNSTVANLAAIGSRLFFTNTTAAAGNELWSSDGTDAGTAMLKDILPGSGESAPALLTPVGSTLYFYAMGSTAVGRELWKSDGTAAGTVLVKDINPGSPYSNLHDLVNVNGTLYFSATDNNTGRELWKSDGTEAGTVMVKDAIPGFGSPHPYNLVAHNGSVYYVARDAGSGLCLWKSNGTEAGTVVIKSVFTGGMGSNPNYLTKLDGKVYFAADDGYSGIELWVSDGTLAGTRMVKDICPGAEQAHVSNLANFKGAIYFTAYGVGAGTELWKSDGTAAGTVMVKDIRPGSANSAPKGAVVVGDTLFFLADDGINGLELWKSDGTTAGTVLVRNIASGTSSSTIYTMVAAGDRLFFTLNDAATGTELWISDGTEAGTYLLKDIYAGSGSSNPSNLMACGDTVLFFSANNGSIGQELWRSDGTVAGTWLVKDIRSGYYASSPSFLTEVNGIIYFSAGENTNGQELWRSDGTEAGTWLVKNINAGAANSNPSYLANVNGTLFFSADDGINGAELWKSDGTAAGTVLVKNIYPGLASSSISSTIAVGNRLYFLATDGVGGVELWTSDGTTAGTVLVEDVWKGAPSSAISNMVALGDKLLFAATDSEHGRELWMAQAPLTALVASINGPTLPRPQQSTAWTFTASGPMQDTVTWTIDWGDGSTPQTASGESVTLSHSYSGTSGVYSVLATASDGQASATSSRLIALRANATGSITREVWNNLSGIALGALLESPLYPHSPSSSGTLTSLEPPANIGNNYGQRMRGYLIPPTSGEYTFWIVGDDEAMLSLGSDDDPASARMIAATHIVAIRYEWDRSSLQQSLPVYLEAGKRYYIEAVHYENTGTDHVSVAWARPGLSRSIIAGQYLEPFTTVAAPTNIAATSQGSDAARITWTASTSNVEGYAIERSLDGEYFQLCGSTTATTTEFLDQGLSPQTQYHYRVRAFGNAGMSEASSVVEVTPAAALDGAATVEEGQLYTLSIPLAENIVQYIVRWGDGQTSSFSGTKLNELQGQVTHVYRDGSSAGTEMTITLDYVDENGLRTNAAHKNVVVYNTPPVATLSAVGPLLCGSPILITFDQPLNASYPRPSDASPVDASAGFHYSFALSADQLAGSYVLAGAEPSCPFTFASAGTHVVYGRIFDVDNGYRDYTVTLAVSIAAPNLSISGPSEVTENSSAAYTAVVGGLGGPISYTWSVLRGETAVDLTGLDTHSDHFSFTPPEEGDYRIVLSVGDEMIAPVHQKLRVRPLSPANLTVASVAAGQITLTWADRSNCESYFIVERSTSADFASTTRFIIDAANVDTYIDNSVAASHVYYYRVRAAGQTYESAASTAVSAATAPAAPLALTATALSASQITLAWGDVSQEQSYLVEMRAGSGTWNLIQTLDANATGYAISELDEGTRYFFRLRARNASGDSSYSNEASAVTTLPAPGALSATSIAADCVELHWQPQSARQTGFVLERATDEAFSQQLRRVTIDADATAYSDRGVQADTMYYYRLRAVSADTVSLNTAAVSVQTPARSADPSHLKAQTTGPFHVDLTWTNNSPTVTAFFVEQSTDGGLTYAVLNPTGQPDTFFTARHLQPQMSYTFRVRGYRADTQQFTNYSSSLSVTTAAVPYVGQGEGLQAAYYNNLDLTGTPVTQVDPSIDFDWDGQPPVPGISATRFGAVWTGQVLAQYSELYTFHVQGDEQVSLWINGKNLIDASDGAGESSGSIYLAAGQRYELRLEYRHASEAAANVTLSWGSPSTARQTLPTSQLFAQVTAPAAPANVNGRAISTDCIDLTWTDQADNESALVLERATDAAFTEDLQSWTLEVNTENYRDNTVVQGLRYYYRLRAVNSAGTSADVLFAPIAVPLAAPTHLETVDVSTTSLVLQWENPAQGHSGFRLEVWDGSVWATLADDIPAASTSWQIEGLTAGVTYVFRLQATGEVQDSDYSAVAVVNTLPAAPNLLRAAARGGTHILLAWDQVQGATSYRLEQLVNGVWTDLAEIPGDQAQYALNSLTPQTMYSFRARACNASGESEASAILETATTSLAPAAFLETDATTGVEGSLLTLSATITDWGSGGPLVYNWRVENASGTAVATSAETVLNFTPADNGVYTVRLVVTDAAGASSAPAQCVLTVLNAAPAATILADSANTNTAGAAAVFQAAASDPGVGDTLSYYWTARRENQTVAWGGESSFQFTPATAGRYVIELAIADDDGAWSVQSLEVDVAAAAPSNPPSAPLPAVTNLALVNDTLTPGDGVTSDPTLQGRVADTSGASHWAVQFDLNGDGSPEGIVFTSGQADGVFTLDLRPFVADTAAMNVRVRAGYDDGHAGYAFGAWSSFGFQYEPPVPEEIRPVTYLPAARNVADFADPSFIVDWAGDGSTAAAYAGPALFIGAFASFADRFTTPLSSQTVVTRDDDPTPQWHTWSDALGQYTSATSGTLEHVVTSVLRGDGSWSYSETYVSAYSIVTTFSGNDGSHWSLVQSGSDQYTLTVQGNAAGAHYVADRLRDQSFDYDWHNLGQSHTYSAEGFECLSFSAAGERTIAGGSASIDENAAYFAWGAGRTDDDGVGQDGAIDWEDHEQTSLDWTHGVQTDHTVDAAQADTALVTHSFNRTARCQSDNRRAEGPNTWLNMTSDDTQTLRIDGQTIYHPDGHRSGITQVIHDQDVLDHLHDQRVTTTVETDAGTGGISFSSTVTFSSSLDRDRVYRQHNDGRTTFINDAVILFELDTNGSNTAVASWSLSSIAHLEQTDTSVAGTTRTFVSDHSQSDTGNSFQEVISRGSRTSDAQGERITGSTRSRQDSATHSEWNNVDHATLDSNLVSYPRPGVELTTVSTGTIHTTETGSGDFTSHAEGLAIADEQGVISRTGSSRHSATTYVQTGTTEDFRTAIDESDTSSANITRDSGDTATLYSQREAEIVTHSTGAASYNNADFYSEEWLDRHETGTHSSNRTQANTRQTVDTNTAGLIVNANSNTTQNIDESGEYDAVNTSQTVNDNGAVSWTETAESTDSGVTRQGDTTNTWNRTIDLRTPKFNSTTETTTTYSKISDGTYLDESSTFTEGADGVSSTQSDRTRDDEGTFTTKSTSYVTYEATDTRTPVTRYTWYTTDEKFNGGGSFWTTATTAESSSTSGGYSYESVTDNGSSESGTTRFISDSLATAKGTQTLSPNVTQTLDSSDHYKADRDSRYSGSQSGHTESRTENGRVVSSSWTQSDYKDEGKTKWEQKLRSVTENSNLSVEKFSRSDKNTTDVQASGTDSHYRHYADSNDYPASGVATYSHTGEEYTWGDSKTDFRKVDTESHSYDTRQAGYVRQRDTESHSDETDKGSYWSTTVYANSRGADGVASSTQTTTSGTHAEGKTNSFSFKDISSTETKITETVPGGYSLLDASDHPVTVAVTRDTVGKKWVIIERAGSGDFVSDTYNFWGTTDGRTRTLSTWSRSDNGNLSKDKTHTNSWATITEKAHQNGTQVLSRTVTSMDDQVNEATDAWYRTSSGGSSSVSESGASEASNYSESEDGGDYTHTTESKRNGTAKETLSRKANSTRETTLDTSESNSTVEGSYYNHVKDSSHIHADGTSTTYHRQDASSDGTVKSHSGSESRAEGQGDILNDQGNVILKNTWTYESNDTRDVEDGEFEDWNWSEWLAEGGVTTYGGSSSYESTMPYTFSASRKSSTVNASPGFDLSLDADSAGRREASYTLWQITDGKGTMQEKTTSETDCSGEVSTSSESTDESEGRYVDQKSTWAEKRVKDEAVAWEAWGDFPAGTGTRTGRSTSGSFDRTEGTLTLKVEAQRDFDGEDWSESETRTQKDVGSVTWEKTSSVKGDETGTLSDGTSIARNQDDSSSESGSDSYDELTETYTTRGSDEEPQTSESKTPGSSKGSFEWNVSQSNQTTATKGNKTSERKDTFKDKGKGSYSSQLQEDGGRENSTESSGESISEQTIESKIKGETVHEEWHNEGEDSSRDTTVTTGQTHTDTTKVEYSVEGMVTVCLDAQGNDISSGSVNSTRKTTFITRQDDTRETQISSFGILYFGFGTETCTRQEYTESTEGKSRTTITNNSTVVTLTDGEASETQGPETVSKSADRYTIHESERSEIERSTVSDYLNYDSRSRSHDERHVITELDEEEEPTGVRKATETHFMYCSMEWLNGTLMESDGKTESTCRVDEEGVTTWDGSGYSTIDGVINEVKSLHAVTSGDGSFTYSLIYDGNILTGVGDNFPHSEVWVYVEGGMGGTLPLWAEAPNSTDYQPSTIEWLYNQAGSFLSSITSELLEAGKTALDAAFGTVDEFLNTINPLDNWISVPDIGPQFGHTDAYFAGQVVGTLGGVAASFVSGNVAACAGKIGMVAKVYSGVSTAAGMAQTGMNLYQGNVGVSDALTFLPVAGFAANKLGVLKLACFAEDTMVLTGSVDQPGVFCEKKIQDLAIGDLVWSKDQDDPDGALELKPITNLYRSIAHDLQTLSLADEQGNVEELLVTDEHPFYAEGQGWTGASGLYIGQYVEGSDGRRLRVVENVDYKSDEGLVVYNLEVEDGHTYFVADGEGEDSWAWVHNTCADARALRKNLLAAGHVEGKYAAHIIPTGEFGRRNSQARDALWKTKAILKKANIPLNSADNGFFTNLTNHGGTHTNEFFKNAAKVLADAAKQDPENAAGTVLAALRSLVP